MKSVRLRYSELKHGRPLIWSPERQSLEEGLAWVRAQTVDPPYFTERLCRRCCSLGAQHPGFVCENSHSTLKSH